MRHHILPHSLVEWSVSTILLHPFFASLHRCLYLVFLALVITTAVVSSTIAVTCNSASCVKTLVSGRPPHGSLTTVSYSTHGARCTKLWHVLAASTFPGAVTLLVLLGLITVRTIILSALVSPWRLTRPLRLRCWIGAWLDRLAQQWRNQLADTITCSGSRNAEADRTAHSYCRWNAYVSWNPWKSRARWTWHNWRSSGHRRCDYNASKP